ncbi:MAG TPA: patatin-like phospholipase family protein [Conexibacter sp.]|jgi:NTE family protein|nr:patatin-like phospholipase family protein [Conexibacter sp.]
MTVEQPAGQPVPPRETPDDLVVSRAAVQAAAEHPPAPGIALCLSGGGYRAMLFHAGALLRLAEAGLLAQVARFSSVSGGSITAGVLALAWDDLQREGFASAAVRRRVVEPLRTQAGVTIDVRAVLSGLLLPRRTVGDELARRYAPLFGEATLQDLPDEPPRFTFNATNLQSTALFRFAKAYAADWRVGWIEAPALPLRDVVAASSAFPPVLSPATVPVSPADFKAGSGEPGTNTDAYRRAPVLTDGGVYDNLGLETAWKNYETVLVSDGGGKAAPAPRVGRTWPAHMHRVLMTIDNQVRSLRKRALLASYRAHERRGAYWSVRTHIADYHLDPVLPCPEDQVSVLAATPTRLAKLPDFTQERLINWGYAVSDAAIRAHVLRGLAPPAAFPYPRAGVG